MKKHESLNISKELYDYIKSKKYEVNKYYNNASFIRVSDPNYYPTNDWRMFYMVFPVTVSIDEFKTLENEFKLMYSNGMKDGKFKLQAQLCSLLGVDDKISDHCYDRHE